MNKNNLDKIRETLSKAASYSGKLKVFLKDITAAGSAYHAHQVWQRLDLSIKAARDEMNAWKIGYPKGKHRIKDDQLETIRQWIAAPHPKPKVRTLAKTVGISPTTVYAVLKELGWKKRAK